MRTRRQKHYWKVVDYTGENTYSSINMCGGDACLTYKPGKTTTPKFGKIFIFKTRADARIFKMADWVIVKVRATNPINAPALVPFPTSEGRLKRWWDIEYTNINPYISSVNGTMLADSVTLLKS